MNCKEVREFLISIYMDDEIPEEKEQTIDAHLKVCAECEGLYRRIRSIKKNYERFRKITPSHRVWENIKNEVMKEEKHVNSIFWRLPVLKVALPVVIFLIISAIFVLRHEKAKHENSVAEFLENQGEFIVSLEMGDTALYEPLSGE